MVVKGFPRCRSSSERLWTVLCILDLQCAVQTDYSAPRVKPISTKTSYAAFTIFEDHSKECAVLIGKTANLS